MALYVYGKGLRWEDSDEWIGWCDTAEEAEVRINGYIDRDTLGVILTLNDDGTVEREYHEHVPTPYNGPTVRARVQFMNKPGCFHRTPIDCASPRPWLELTEDRLWRVVATSVVPEGQREAEQPWDCRCGEWQEIEGAPDAVAKMVAKYAV